MRLGLPHHAALRAAARIRRRARRGHPGRLPDAQDIHHQYPSLAQRPHGRLRRYLGGVPGAGEGGRPRRHSCGRQRYRHAYVRQAHPRGAGGLRASRRSPQSAIGGLELSPHLAARRKGLPVYGETLHQYLIYSANDYKRPNGQIYHTYPSLKSQDDQTALWQGTANDTIHCIATDELCCTLKDKTVGRRIDDTTGGNSGVEPRLGVMYTEMVARRGYSLSQYVDLVSSNAAKIMGLYPRKGAIAPKSDADITILDPTRRGKVRAADLHETDYTPWEGHDIFAWPVVTILRGKVMVRNGEYFASPQDGRYLKRKISQNIRDGAAL